MGAVRCAWVQVAAAKTDRGDEPLCPPSGPLDKHLVPLLRLLLLLPAACRCPLPLGAAAAAPAQQGLDVLETPMHPWQAAEQAHGAVPLARGHLQQPTGG